jgi:hypothetical protein
MTTARAIPNTLALLAVALLNLTACLAAGQSSASTFRESLNDARWTGPLLAPNASTLPPGHILIEPYLYDVITQGFFDSSGARVSVPHENSYGSLTYVNYGLFNKFTVGMIPTFGYNEPSNGPGSSGVGIGDLTVQAQYRLHLFREGSWTPTTSINVQETLPTGKYDQLNRLSDGLGAGSYTTTLGLYTQTFFWMPNGRILRTRFNVTQAFSKSVSLQDVSVYGTSDGFRGHANPGAALLVDLAAEYSITSHWVLAGDAVYHHQYNAPVAGYNIASPTQSILLNSGSSQYFGLAPAIEYNFNNRVGIIVGPRIFLTGKNTADLFTPAIAVNIVH